MGRFNNQNDNSKKAGAVNSNPDKRHGVDAPYHHVPLLKLPNDKSKITTPLFDSKLSQHDHYYEGGFSGSFQCEITCLTDSHFGNFQDSLVRFPELLNKLKSDNEKVQFKDTKKVVVPNFIDTEKGKRALISGSSIMGMLRNNVAAMVSAPMQRVAEKSMSYRPNMTFLTKGSPKPSYNSFVGVVKRPQEKAYRIELYEVEPTDIKFGSKNKAAHVNNYSYGGGTDRNGVLAKAFSDKSKVHQCVEVSQSAHFVGSLGLSDDLIKQFELTTEHLIDLDNGHISSSHPSNDKFKDKKEALVASIKSNRKIKDWFAEGGKDLLIYVEAEVDEDERPVRIVSFGNNFRYRWRYKDSVRYLDSGKSEGRLRPELVLSEEEAFYFWNAQEEEKTRHELPKKLNLARSLFGDVYQRDGLLPQNTPKSSGTFDRFAGKVSVNHAIELNDGSKTSVFEQNCLYAMPRPGSPKANAEHNLKQSSKSSEISSWGWLADDKDSEIAGRKVYRHQRSPKRFDKGSDGQAFANNLSEEHAPLLQYVSPKETRYGFTLRFKNLTQVELGALAIALQPDLLLDEVVVSGLKGPVKNYLENNSKFLNPDSKSPVFANKLGYGKPLGMGSVRFNIVNIMLLQRLESNSSDQLLAHEPCQQAYSKQAMSKAVLSALNCLSDTSLFEKSNGEKGRYWAATFLPWLILKNYQCAEDSINYPMVRPHTKKGMPQKDATTVEYHSSIRNAQVKQRRLKDEDKGTVLNKNNQGLLKPHMKLKEYSSGK